MYTALEFFVVRSYLFIQKKGSLLGIALVPIDSEGGRRSPERSGRKTGSEEGRRPSERSTRKTGSEEGRRPSERSYPKMG